jgi:hypothetical protein
VGLWFGEEAVRLTVCDVAVSDATGQAVGRVQYAPYGEVITSTLPADLTDRLFTGQRLDSSTGLYYYNARYYDPFGFAQGRPGPLHPAQHPGARPAQSPGVESVLVRLQQPGHVQ